MKITFVYPDIRYRGESIGYKGYYYHGIGYLAAVLKQRGHMVSLLCITKPLKEEEYCQQLARHLANGGQDLIAFSATTNRFPYVKDWARWTKENFSVFIICGGVHPTLNPASVIQTPALDAICVGEGEYALAELCDCLQREEDISSIPNIWLKKDGEIYINPPRPLIQDLDNLPFADREIFDYPSLYLEREGKASVMASRGCPYDCYYCCNKAISSVYKGQRYFRLRSVANVINELKQILARYPFIKGFAFDDDILPLKQDWFEQFTFQYGKEIGLPFTCNVRPNLMTRTIAKLLKEAGCSKVHMGIESGNCWIRSHIINRRISDDQIITAAKLCHDFGIRVHTYNMVGLPYESMAQILDTIKLNAIVSPSITQVAIFYPYQGTRLFDICQQNRLLTDKDVRDYTEGTVLAVNLIERNQILFCAQYFILLVRTYAYLFRLPKWVRQIATRLVDRLLLSKATALIVFPPLTKLVSIVFEHKLLLKYARTIKQHFIDT